MCQFEKLLQDNIVYLERYVKFKINNKHNAEDIIQDVCLTATMKFDSLKEPEFFKAWLIGIANHKCNDYYRRKANDMNISLEALSESTLRTGRCGISEHSIVRDTLDCLGDKEKQILYLFFFKEMSQEDISKRLNIPLGTVKSRLHYAKEKFKQHYPDKEISKGENNMKNLPEYLPEYIIEAVNEPPFPVVFEELPNWFIVPKIGEEITWASYDLPKRKSTEIVRSKVNSVAFIHGIAGVEISTEFENKGTDYPDSPQHIYYAQLTNTHCRWLGESYTDKNGAKHLLTFLDGDDFISEWGYGEDNCGSETHLAPLGIIKRNDNIISVSSAKNSIDVVGKYTIKINNTEYETICVMNYFESGALTEQYIDKNGKTILWRRFNKNDWGNNRYGKLWSEMLPENEKLIVNGETFVHWYDCVSDYIF